MDYDELMKNNKVKLCYFCYKKYDLPAAWILQKTQEAEGPQDEDSSDTDSDDDNDTASEQEAKDVPA